MLLRAAVIMAARPCLPQKGEPSPSSSLAYLLREARQSRDHLERQGMRIKNCQAETLQRLTEEAAFKSSTLTAATTPREPAALSFIISRALALSALLAIASAVSINPSR